MKKALLWYSSAIIILGTLALALHYTIGLEITYITYKNYGIGMYYYDFSAYLNGLRDSINHILGTQILTGPTQPEYNWNWTQNPGNVIKSLLNGFFFAINIMIFILNASLVLIKLIIYMIIIALALLGLNNEKLDIYNFATFVYSIQIPYIDYLNY